MVISSKDNALDERKEVLDCRASSQSPLAHISVCICTFKRPGLLADLLQKLILQATNGKFTYSITIVDNDADESGRATVEQFKDKTAQRILYVVEPTQSIALARNKAVANATGDYIAFIDDDELPIDTWLLELYATLLESKANGVLGPVKPHFPMMPPQWVLKAGIFDRPNSRDYPSGMVLHWSQTGTGNALIQRHVLEKVEGPFRLAFGSGGEDLDFFQRAMDSGNVFVWCAGAIAYETVPVERTRVLFQLKRALLRGKVSLSTSSGNLFGIMKSVVACGLYTILLPVSLVIGRHLFLKCLIRDCDHLGKLMALARIDLVRENYVSR